MDINQFDWAAKWAVYAPDRIAFAESETQRTLSFGQLHRLGNRLAGHLNRAYGIERGDRIAILAENCLEYLLLFVAAQKTGAILVPLNYRLASAEIDFLLDNAAPRWLVVEAKFRDRAAATTAWARIPHHSSIREVADYCTPDTDRPEDQHFENAAIQADDPLFILYTSGTTGFPKGALYTHRMLFWNSINTALSLIVNTESRTVNCMPPFHTGGWNVLTTPFFHHGGFSCLMKSFDPELLLALIGRERVSILMAVPTMLKLMADSPAFATADLSSLHYIIVGGEALPLPLIERWHARGVPIRQGFGMTEVGPNLTSLHQEDAVRKMGSIGRPNFYIELQIVDERGEVCPPSQAGELWLRGPVVTPGYWQNTAATQAAFHEGWFRTGDRVRRDEEGYLFVVDRIKNMYISGGENVYPAEVERVLLAHPSIGAAVVVGVPDSQWGEVGRAFLVLQAPVSPDDVITYCRSRLARFKVPKTVVLLDALPQNDTGKVDRRALRERGKTP
ncbi:MAG: long-chain fatty acid--CoA ligase [Bacteroidota bacterium]